MGSQKAAGKHRVKSEKSPIKNKNTGDKGQSPRHMPPLLGDEGQSTRRKLIIQEETADIQETFAKVHDTCPLFSEMKAKVQETIAKVQDTCPQISEMKAKV